IFYGVDLFFRDGDLAISDRQASVGDNVNLQARVRIDGNTTAKNVVVRFYEGEDQIGTDQIIPELHPADSFAMVTVPYFIEKDYALLYAIVDPDSILGELKEDNNVVTLELILGKGDPIRQVVNFPNPFKDYTEFTYILGKPMTDVTIKVFTVRGRPVRTFDMCPSAVGYNSLGWDGTDARGDQIANGTYIYKVMATAENGETHEVIERIVRMR
ncbi:MAG: FlgD immunoglobulin-like domain containing protein, partial [bacterium]